MKNTPRLGIAFLLIALLLTACTPIQSPGAKTMLEITSMVSSLGGEGAHNEIGVYSFTVILTNHSGSTLNIKSITPEVQKAFASRLLETNFETSVEKAVPSNESIEINGKLRFDFKSLTKQQITDMGEPVAGLDVTSQAYLPLPPTR